MFTDRNSWFFCGLIEWRTVLWILVEDEFDQLPNDPAVHHAGNRHA
jgi:hypothetical protein